MGTHARVPSSFLLYRLSSSFVHGHPNQADCLKKWSKNKSVSGNLTLNLNINHTSGNILCVNITKFKHILTLSYHATTIDHSKITDTNDRPAQTSCPHPHLPSLACCLCRTRRWPQVTKHCPSCDTGREGSSWPGPGPGTQWPGWACPGWPWEAAARWSACSGDCPGCAQSWVPSALSGWGRSATQTPCNTMRR